MKKSLINIVIFIILLFTSTLFAKAQIGPVLGISQNPNTLPQNIITFLNSYFPGATPTDVELKTLTNIYEIELNNNVDMKFDATTGQWLKIDAPDKSTISQVIIYDLLPGEIYNYLNRKSLIYKINEMEYNPRIGYKIETIRGHEIYFNLNGNKIKKPLKW